MSVEDLAAAAGITQEQVEAVEDGRDKLGPALLRSSGRA
jgi:hypothetical protein